jgi:tetratricopeptide (TPR) repeat protein
MMGYANILCKLKRFQEAIRMYNRIIESRPNLINAYVCLAMIHEYWLSDEEKSAEMINTILERDPENMYANFLRAKKVSHFQEKIEILKKLVKKYPSYAKIYNDIGKCFARERSYRQAIVWLKKGIEIAPKFAPSFNSITWVYMQLTEYK